MKGINYLNRCLKYLKKSHTTSIFNIFNFKNNELKKNNPKITVIIPIYNCQKSIELSLASILNQKLKDFEIILINDNSTDNSLKIINKIKKTDDRIKIINNLKNMGTLYSRSIGALNAKGKYILCLDNDDLFLDDEIFEIIYNLADNDKYDIVEFKAFTIPNYHPNINDLKQNTFNTQPNDLILHQPELAIFPISKNNTYFPNDFLIWGKCIKTKLYQMSIKALGVKRFSIYNCWTEDISIVFIIFNLANSYIFVNIYGILHIISNLTTTYMLPIEHKIFADIFLLDIIIDFLKGTEKFNKLIVLKVYDIFNKIKNYRLNEQNKKYLKLTLQKIFDCKYINRKDKIIIMKKFCYYIT
jgi:glycosyltransferase involved in cell wall biosynthesis